MGPNYATFHEWSNVKSKSNVPQMRVDSSGYNTLDARWINFDSLDLSENVKKILICNFLLENCFFLIVILKYTTSF